MSYLDATQDLYKEAAISPNVGLCCTTTPIWQFPGLSIPKIMQEMNYGCGSTVSAQDLVNDPKILYVGVGGGMELLQFSYFSRQMGGVTGVDSVDEMLEASRKNFKIAEQENDWFKSEYVNLVKGDALNLPIPDESMDVAAQNCLFNIFKMEDLQKAVAEMYRVLKPHGRLVMSDPICEQPMNDELRNDDRLRAQCLSGSIPLKDYVKVLTDAGFGTIEIRGRRSYRVLSPNHYPTDELIHIESIEIAAIKDPMPEDGPCMFTGKTAIYYGNEPYFDDNKGHVLLQNQPLAVCDKTASALAKASKEIHVSESTWHYNGGGCC
ncbi:methyltransferase domain-containing protein [Flagellimonas taeanensis]|uniref:arsenosugar biosynthesis arsenite methyltransferase ArsM n=1 Tax=Flavobacteriaceae TaxID=49546 RepID=UPI000E69C4D0|nr:MULTISPECIES: arsenosugar biosynthesis arsenite methyltransferase ArsM [Allomuricauda]MDC6385035.1 arsenosugar biosynthesis arsenite methyltransferase ArsM [Muricauda sp. SK9]RIV48996.1 methyltransferase domain-containing protein [Allomuricauda taeanensis]